VVIPNIHGLSTLRVDPSSEALENHTFEPFVNLADSVVENNVEEPLIN
jgi:hypothetical protein